MIARLNNLPYDRMMGREFIIITHKIDAYLFSGEECYKELNNGFKRVNLIRCGNSNGHKINGKFRSLTALNKIKRPTIQVLVSYNQLTPF